MDGPRCKVNTNLKMIRCSPFYRQRVTASRFLVPCTLFPAASEYGFEMGEVVGRRREEKGNSFLGVVKEYARGVDLFFRTPGD